MSLMTLPRRSIWPAPSRRSIWPGRYGAGSGVAIDPLTLSEFYAPLTHSLALTRGVGSATYTRATTAWEFDNEGKLVTVPSGAARFGGARMVRNLLAGSSQDLSNASWSKTGSPTITYTGGVSTVTTPGAGTECKISQYPSFVNSSPTNAGKVASAYWKIRGTNGRTIKLNIQEGSPGYEGNEITHTFNGDWQLVYSQKTLVSVTGTQAGIAFRKPLTDAALTFDLAECQLENVTGQADQTASEYVSVGVLSAPYHGAGIDGVKYFSTNKDGSPISAASLLGYHSEGARTNSLLYSRDLTNAAWVKTNVTAAKTATGIDNAANSASTLTAGADNATILQTLTLASAARSSSAYVKRRTGTGTIRFTRDGGTTWTDINSLINSSTWTRVKIENTSVTNPSIGFLIATSGDSIDVDVVQDEAGAFASSPIVTTSAAVTRNGDVLSYATASNWSDTAGAARASVQFDAWANASGTAIGGTNGLVLSTSNSGAQAKDGTNTVNGPTGTPSGIELLAIGWGSGALKAASGGTLGTAGSYDGAFGLSTIAIGAPAGYIKETHIWQSALTDAQLVTVTTP